jgi:hypothetical protein
MRMPFFSHSRRGVVPVGEAVDDHVVFDTAAQVEGLDGDPLDLDLDRRRPRAGCFRSSRFIMCSKQSGQQMSAPRERPILPDDVGHRRVLFYAVRGGVYS